MIGDSTAVGVGAHTPNHTLAGRVAAYIGATYTENYAKSSATVRGLPKQIAKAKLPHYNLILLQIGANDILLFRGAPDTARRLGVILKTLPAADKILFISAGDVGGVKVVPPPLRAPYTKLTIQYHDAFEKLAAANGITYINMLTHPLAKHFVEHLDAHLAEDGLHPTSEGYEVWFRALQPYL